MLSSILLLLAFAAVAWRTVQRRHRFCAWECVWKFRSGPLTVELRRHAGLARLSGDSLEFPQPREFRVLALCVAGVPLWSQRAIASLPAEADSRIDAIDATEFDHLFDPCFRRAWTRRTARMALRTHG